MNPEIEEIIYLALESVKPYNGITSRGKACLALKIDRCDLDDWIATYEKEHGIWPSKDRAEYARRQGESTGRKPTYRPAITY